MTDIADRLYRDVLVVRCQAGDPAAFAELIAFYQPRLAYFLRKMGLEAQNTEDLLQEIWLAVYKDVPRLAAPAAFGTWLYQIARNRLYREKRQRRHFPGALDGIDLPDDHDAGEAFTAEDAGRVHAALDQLAPEHREVLLLRFIEEMTYEEIARVTGCQLGTVRSRIHYAKHALRRIIERTIQHE